METLPESVTDALANLILFPGLEKARALETALRDAGIERRVFGRVNQKSSIEAASESDRGITERLANAFDASLTAARLLKGIERSDRTLTPRAAGRRFFCENELLCEWSPSDAVLAGVRPPVVEFWEEPTGEQRFRKHKPSDGLVTVLVQDSGTGISREKMSTSILTLNSDSKLQQFEAIGQFGHGGSSALAFCESCLVISQPRFGAEDGLFYWTLIVPESEPEESKQTVVRRWFSTADGLPLAARVGDFPKLPQFLPGTLVWHYGYNKGGWVKRISGPEQSNPWGRLTRLFFSYPLPFVIRGQFARTDSKEGNRTVKGAYYRIFGTADATTKIAYRSGEMRERLKLEGTDYGEFSVYVCVFVEPDSVRDYVDRTHPIVLTLNGQNHGEMTRTLIAGAGLPEISSSTIIEVRLDSLDQEALGEIISNSREQPKSTAFTRELRDTLVRLIQNDEGLRALEKQREDEKARQSSADLSRKMSEFLSRILSDAFGGPASAGSGTGTGTTGTRVRTIQPSIPASDPPKLLEFISEGPIFVAEGMRIPLGFLSDARPPKYSFHGDNPRCFATLELTERFSKRVQIIGRADMGETGYGSVSIACEIDPNDRVPEPTLAGKLMLRIQSADGSTLQDEIEIGVKPKPDVKEKAVRRDVKAEIVFCAPASADTTELAELLGEPAVRRFGTGLQKYGQALQLSEDECAYWGEKSEREEGSVLSIEINVGNAEFLGLLKLSRDVNERIAAKERYVRDVVLDCYQHAFQLENTPEGVRDAISQDPDEKRRAADIHFNHDKAIRLAHHELSAARSR